MARKKGLYKRGRLWWICYQSLDGSIVRESTGSDKLKDAERLLTNRRHSIDEGKEPEVKRISNYRFIELAEEYMKWAKSQKSFNSKVYLIRNLVNKYGNLPLRKFSPLLLNQYQTERHEAGNKPATINRLLATLKHMFTKAVDWEMVEEDTLKRIRKVKMLSEHNRRLRYLVSEECTELLNSCEPHLKPIVITALNTGMRKGEILSLKWENVDLKHGFILLEITKNGERREIPINATLKRTLHKIERRLDVPYVFYDKKTGKRYRDVKTSFKTACRRAKIMDFRFHDLRHTFASHLVMAGIDITTVKELLGHKTLTMTLRYAHLAPAHKVKAVDILDTIINEKLLPMKMSKSVFIGKQPVALY